MDVMPVVAGSVTIEVAFSGHIVGVRRGAGFDRGGEALLLQHSQQRFLLRHQGVDLRGLAFETRGDAALGGERGGGSQSLVMSEGFAR